MKYYTFYRESNNFDDILGDPNVKQNISTQICCEGYLILGFKTKVSEGVLGYIVLKYGDDMRKITERDYRPVMNVDYTPDITNKV